jgi:hypothetical protein
VVDDFVEPPAAAGPPPGRGRRIGLALALALLVLTGLVGGLVVFLAPAANAAGGCGG